MKTTYWKTKITDAREDAISVRGYDLADLIGRITFGEMFYLLMRGELPTLQEGKMIDAMLVACADHGIVPTSVVARYAVAAGTPLQGALAAGLLTIGDVYGGAVEQAAQFFAEALQHFEEGSETKAARQIVDDHASHNPIPGFGHPLHPNGDPRSISLLALAGELGLAGRAIALAKAIEKRLRATRGKTVPLNADGALAVVALDLGFNWRVTRSFMLFSRAAGTLAHSSEELIDGTRWRRPPPAEYVSRTHDDYYEGPPSRSLPPERTP